ncbi:MAG: transcriptional repressor LexA, partial [Actinobacteria bacterium]|nr:transcriptional repressor LexA [Actinomycetota bacterium]
KTFKRDGENVVLVPSNSSMKPMTFHPSEVSIFGKVVTVLRRL